MRPLQLVVPRVFVATREVPLPALRLMRSAASVRVYAGSAAPPRETLLTQLRGAGGLFCTLTDRIDAEVFAVARKLRIVANMAVGYDNIDVEEATKRGVMVTNTPGVLTETVADATMALILAVARRIPEADSYVRRGLWKLRWSPMMMVGRDVHGKTLGVYGLGRIGGAVAKRASGFGMRLLYFDTARNPDLEKTYGIEFVPLDRLFTDSDFVSIHVPLTPETRRSVGKREIGLMKSSAYLVNTARGEIVDQRALIRALGRNEIAGAALDVFEHEPIETRNELLGMKNVVLTPHLGSASIETRTGMALMAARNIVSALKGEVPPNLLNREVLTRPNHAR